jgi:hypothetical protein
MVLQVLREGFVSLILILVIQVVIFVRLAVIDLIQANAIHAKQMVVQIVNQLIQIKMVYVKLVLMAFFIILQLVFHVGIIVVYVQVSIIV